MISTPVVYTSSEHALIESKKNSPHFCSKTWEDEDLKELKKKIKQFYILEQKHQCPYCKQIFHSSNGRMWDIEHVISRSIEKNFMFEPLNLCVSCFDCNNKKSHKLISNSKARKRYPLDPKLYSIIHPHLDDYAKHIMVIKPGFYYVALEYKGEKTIEVCGLNRFYEYAGYESGDDGLMLHLTQELAKSNDEVSKRELRSKIAFLAIQGNR